MSSLRRSAACVGASGNFSLMRDFFGFVRSRVPPDPEDANAEVSVRRQMDALEGRHVHLNVIRVGFDAIPAADRPAAFERLDYAVYRTRIVFRQRNLGVGRVLHWHIPAADANGLDDIGSTSEAEELWRSWSVPNNGVDVFMVRTISANFVGRSPVGGSCSKGSKDDGLIGGRIDRADGGTNNSPAERVARTFAHEIGHFLGLSHNHDPGENCTNCPTTAAGRRNLMAQTRCTSATCGGSGVRDSMVLTSAQGTTMRGHCSVRPGC
jgi:hypothetical protein